MNQDRETLINELYTLGASNAAAEMEAMQLYIIKLEEQLRSGCTCGSGAHPRKCERHPERFRMHCREIEECQELDASREALKQTKKLISAHAKAREAYFESNVNAENDHKLSLLVDSTAKDLEAFLVKLEADDL